MARVDHFQFDPILVGGQTQHFPAHLLPGLHWAAVDFQHLFAVLDPGARGRRSRHWRAQHRAQLFNPMPETTPVDENREQQIGQWPGCNNRHAPPDFLPVEGTMRFVRRDLALTFIKHFDETTERNQPDRPFRPVTPEGFRPECLTKTDRKTQHLDPTPACHQEMPQFVHKNQHAEHDQESRCVEKESVHLIQ